MLRFLIPVCLALTACVPSTTSEVPERRAPSLDLPPMKTFSARRGPPALRPNAQIAQDFLDLSFQMESGRTLPFLTKFSGPIKVAVLSGSTRGLEVDLAQLLSRLRNEAGIPITRAKKGEEAQIVIEAIPRKTLQRAVPQAACFVVPNVAGWADFKRNRGRAVTDWTKLTQRTRATVIIPSDVSPQEVRDCLHEEIAQALGPLNDLYRLPDSTFNDDNFHTVLTGFDMLILRTYYAPEIRNGMTREAAAQVLPRVLYRLNPRGRRAAGPGSFDTPQAWGKAISGALSLRASNARRATLAAQAVRIAQERGWRDNRLAFSLFVQGRVTLASNSEVAIASFLQAGALYKSLYGNSVQSAHVATQMAAFALSSGQSETTVRIVNDALPAAKASENAALLATLLMLKAEALQFAERPDEARVVRQDALAWGRYGFGSEENVRARLLEISALAPSKKG